MSQAALPQRERNGISIMIEKTGRTYDMQGVSGDVRNTEMMRSKWSR
jgi:hypothetical protein